MGTRAFFGLSTRRRVLVAPGRNVADLQGEGDQNNQDNLEAAKAIGKENLNPWLGVMFSLGQRHFDMSYCHSFFEREVREDRISEEHFNTYRKIAFGQPTNPSDGDKLMSDLLK